MAQQLDTTTASELISELDSHFATLRRYLMPPYQPTGRNSWSESQQKLNADGFQKIADEMRLYLGLTRTVHVRLLTTMFDHDNAGTGLGGMQWSEHPWDSDIILSCRLHMQTVNLAAALAHEMTHAFLEYKRFRGENEERNELLTEAGAIYLGMGELLWDGYAPISWNDQKQPNAQGIFSGPVTTYTSSVGYIDVDSVNLLMDLSSRCSGCHYRDVAATAAEPTSPMAQKKVPSLLRRWTNQRSAARHEETTRLTQRVEEIEHLYGTLDGKFSSRSFLARVSQLVGPEWSDVGSVYALYASGKLKLDVNGITARMVLLKSNARWNAREARTLDTDTTTEVELIQKVLDQLEK